ncbi:MAG: pyridoxamine 5'-phosphate oxidase family protein [Thermomicrobiales bacterium]
MTERQPIEAKNLDGYGGEPIPWSDVRDALAAPQGPEMIYFLGTIRPDGQPHAAGIGPSWFDGDFYICASLNSQKIKNLLANPNCTLSTRVSGFDVTLEGTASRVDDPEILESVAAIYREGGWPANVEGDALIAPYSAPSAGPPPWHIFRIRYTSVVALRLSETGGVMKWRFAD